MKSKKKDYGKKGKDVNGKKRIDNYYCVNFYIFIFKINFSGNILKLKFNYGEKKQANNINYFLTKNPKHIIKWN